MALYNNAAIRIPAKPRKFGSRQITYRARPFSLPLSFSRDFMALVSYFRARWQLKLTPEVHEKRNRRADLSSFAQRNKPADKFRSDRAEEHPARSFVVLRPCHNCFTAFISRKHRRVAEITLAAFYIAIIRDRKDDVVLRTSSSRSPSPFKLALSISPFVNVLRYVARFGLDLGALDASSADARSRDTLDIARVKTILASFLSNSSTRAQERRNENGDCSKRE